MFYIRSATLQSSLSNTVYFLLAEQFLQDRDWSRLRTGLQCHRIRSISTVQEVYVGSGRADRSRVPTVNFVMIGTNSIKGKDVVGFFDSKVGVSMDPQPLLLLTGPL